MGESANDVDVPMMLMRASLCPSSHYAQVRLSSGRLLAKLQEFLARLSCVGRAVAVSCEVSFHPAFVTYLVTGAGAPALVYARLCLRRKGIPLDALGFLAVWFLPFDRLLLVAGVRRVGLDRATLVVAEKDLLVPLRS
ncbi:MAG: hypothetical protein BJ554DRAFT_5524 [Olpidium bornovanus]|uniref:Uncharacterized protein n=1 Tax=Olpidium bornovanus TaxID=278681 RepID=A0A8H7ZZA2_9FUNG|nr:MAG: hypothetical protein BJ554DRAFT_5524 [Olpidium bornovanus]